MRKWWVRKLNGKWTAVSPSGGWHITFSCWRDAFDWASDWRM